MKKRLDQLIFDRNLVSSREKAKQLKIEKLVLVNNQYETKPGQQFKDDIDIIIKDNYSKFVSRAGYKLDKAINDFNISISNKVALDIGSSTGGFTDCMLQNNAKLVYALDVGTNQLDWSIRKNPKVISMEKTNFRYVTKNSFELPIEFACCDVSFISLDKIIPVLKEIILMDSFSVLLIKPQFECSRDEVNKGKIADPKIHIRVIKKVIKLCIFNGFSVINISYSPILGNKKKNMEFIILIKKTILPVNKFSEKELDNMIKDASIFFNKIKKNK